MKTSSVDSGHNWRDNYKKISKLPQPEIIHLIDEEVDAAFERGRIEGEYRAACYFLNYENVRKSLLQKRLEL